MPGADESGELADADIAQDILREAAGEPEASESDTGSARQSRRPAPSRRPGKTDDSQASEDDLNNDSDLEADLEDEPAAAEGNSETAAQAGEADLDADGTDEAQAEADSVAAADPANTDPKKDDTPEWAKKRFAEMSGEIRRLRQENQRLQTGGNAAQQRANLPMDVQILEAETPEQIADLREQAEKLEEWAIRHHAGKEADPDRPDDRSYSSEEVAQVRVTAKKQLRALEAREKQLEHQQRFNAAAAQLYPGFSDPDSQESQGLRYILQHVPELRRLPNYRVIIGDALAGERARMQKAQAAATSRKGPDGRPLPGKPAATTERPKPPAASNAPVRGNAAPASRVVIRQKARERAFRSGSEADIARLVEASVG